MPELPEVETITRQLQPLAGDIIIDSRVFRSDLRKPFPAKLTEQIIGKEILAVNRVGKYIFMSLKGGSDLIFHLGMSGKMALFRISVKKEIFLRRNEDEEKKTTEKNKKTIKKKK